MARLTILLCALLTAAACVAGEDGTPPTLGGGSDKSDDILDYSNLSSIWLGDDVHGEIVDPLGQDLYELVAIADDGTFPAEVTLEVVADGTDPAFDPEIAVFVKDSAGIYFDQASYWDEDSGEGVLAKVSFAPGANSYLVVVRSDHGETNGSYHLTVR